MTDKIPVSRNSVIDAAKGITILLVALYHNTLIKNAIEPDFFTALGLVRMPIFFFMSGIIFDPFRQGWFIKKVRGLLVPYLLGNIITAFIFGFNNTNSLMSLISFFYANGKSIPNGVLWFLPHLLLSFCVSASILYLTKNSIVNEWQKAFLLLVVYWAGSTTIGLVPEVRFFGFSFRWLPWGIDFVLLTSFFLLMGSFLRNYVINLKFRPLALIISLLLFFSAVLISDAKLNLFNRILIDPIGVLVGALSGIYLLLMLAKSFVHIKGVKELVIYTGRASLIILILHHPSMKLLNSFFSKAWVNLNPGLVGSISFIISIVASLVCFAILNATTRWFNRQNFQIGHKKGVKNIW